MMRAIASAVSAAMVLMMAGCGSADAGSASTAAASSAASTAEDAADAGTADAVSEFGSTDSVSKSGTSGGQSGDLIVFAAASMTETLQKCADLYKDQNPDINITFNFDSSGTLKTQIQEGAACDLFISAAQKQMDQMDITAAGDKSQDKNPERLDLIDPDTRVNILENKVVLTVPKDNPKDIKSFDDLAQRLKDGGVLMAMGNSDVPVGQYTQKILDYYGLKEDDLASKGEITYGSNVKEVTTQVSEAAVDCGVVYCTDATSAGLDIIDYATPEMCGQVIYPAAVTKNAQNPDAAKDFLSFIQSDACMKIFASVGFSAVK
ncbi:MAG: molybdate ABC transporter substrate-binding protein [Lachnospiraceae bacterium]|nr:molybdate ABC transporter substrate-binding protein [Lachnospiraceae bacterium]